MHRRARSTRPRTALSLWTAGLPLGILGAGAACAWGSGTGTAFEAALESEFESAVRAQPETPADPGAEPAAPEGEALELPPAEELFERYIETIGGRDALDAHRTREIKGTFRGRPFTGAARLTMQAEVPNKLHVVIEEPLGFRFEMCYDGETVWERANDNPPREVIGARAIEFIESSDFFGEAQYKDRYTSYQTIGSGAMGDVNVYVVEAVSHNSRQRRLLFDADTGLFIGEQNQVARLNPELRKYELRVTEIVLGDYTEFDGVLYPTSQRQKVVGDDAESVFEYTSIKVNLDEPFDFSPPEDMVPADREEMQPGDG